MNNSKNILNYMFGKDAIKNLGEILDKKESQNNYVIYYIDEYFQDNELIAKLPIHNDLFYHFWL